MTERLTRKERQERTRSHLLEAAGAVFARRGFAHASVDQVAAEAGYTKGAFYANFASKEELFFEFAAHAARSEEFRGELVARYHGLIARIAAVIGDYAQRIGFTPPGPVE